MLIAIVILIAPSVKAQSFDIYGGRTDITGTNTGKWHTQKVGNRWWIITPLGNALFYQSIGSWQGTGAGKYGTACQGAAQISIEVSSWGFNGFGQNDSNPNGLPNGACSSTPGFVNLPHMDIIETSLYSTAANFSLHQNFTGYASRPTKNITWGNPSVRSKGYTPGLVDVFDPIYTTFVNALANAQLPPFAANPFNFGILMDDTDFLNGFGGTSDFDTINAGHNKTNLAYNIATTSPIQTWAGGASGCCDGGQVTYSGTNVFYSDVNVYTKGLMASPPAACNTTTACSWGTFIQKKYGSNPAVAGGTSGLSLNSQWGANYTTLGSTGLCVGFTDATGSICGSGSGSSSETVGTGNGAMTVFTRTLTNHPVSAHSVQLVLNNTDILTGDCPGCGVTSGGQFFAMVSPLVFSLNSANFPCAGNWGHPCYRVGDGYIDSNGYLETVTIGGETGSSVTWNGTYKGTTTTGTVTFRNDAPLPITGPQPWLQDDPCTGSGSGFGAASFFAQITYHGTPPAGTSSQIPSIQRGNTCVAGKTVFVTGPDSVNPSWVTGYDVYMSCRNAGGGALNGCGASGSGQPPLTLQASNVPVAHITTISCVTGTVTINTASADGFSIGDTLNLMGTVGGFDLDHNNPVTVASTPLTTQFTYTQPGGICPSASGSGGTVWKWYLLPNAPMASGAALPTPPSTINYTTGVVQVTFSAPLQNTIPLTINYISNGFGYGTGLMDEDGRNTAWMGNESICLLNVANTGAGSTSWACRPSNPGGFASPSMNQKAAADIMAYQAQYAAKYFGTMKNAITTSAPSITYMGADTLGDWCTPPHQEVLAGALPYLDILWTTWCADATEAAQRFNYFSTARGDAPMMNFITICANLDSAAAAFGMQNCADTTQPARALRWYDTVNTELNTIGTTNTYQWVGLSWWGLRDYIPGENTNWGLKTPQDNAYDGSEAASGSVACSAPLAAYTCGNQPAPGGSAVRPFGNLIGGTKGVKAANALWLAIPSGGVPPTASTPTALPVAGTYTATQNVALSTSSAGAIICWQNTGLNPPPATNGTTGCTHGTLYSGQISVPATITLDAVAGGTGWMDSSVGDFPYIINTVVPPPPPSGSGSIPPLIILSADKCKLMTPSDELCKGYDDLNNLLGSCIVCGL